jgi:hypothetical protein
MMRPKHKGTSLPDGSIAGARHAGLLLGHANFHVLLDAGVPLPELIGRQCPVTQRLVEGVDVLVVVDECPELVSRRSPEVRKPGVARQHCQRLVVRDVVDVLLLRDLVDDVLQTARRNAGLLSELLQVLDVIVVAERLGSRNELVEFGGMLIVSQKGGNHSPLHGTLLSLILNVFLTLFP